MSEDAQLRQLLVAKSPDLERQDFFAVLSVGEDANPDAVTTAYRSLAKQLHPDRLARLSLKADEADKARRLYAFATEAYKVLVDPAKREELVRAKKSGQANPFVSAGLMARQNVEDAKIQFHKGKRLINMRAWAEAETAFRKSLEKLPRDADLLTLLGWAVFNNSNREEGPRLDEARRCWQLALEIERGKALTHYYLSLYHKAKGEAAKQRQSLQLALDADPGLIEAQREVRLLEMRSGTKRGRGPRSLLAALFPTFAKRDPK